MSFQFDNEYVQCVVEIDEKEMLRVYGTIKQMRGIREAIIKAPNTIDRMTTYTGSGLPFPCAQIAFENTPNIIKVTDPTGNFDTRFSYPNSYYTIDGHTKIESSIFFTIYWKNQEKEKTIVRLPLTDSLPLRTLNYRPGYSRGPQYYSDKSDIVGIRGAEATMYAIAEAKKAYDIA